MLDMLDAELERLRQIRLSLESDKEELQNREKEFRRLNSLLIQNINIKEGAIRLSEQKIKNMAIGIYEQVKFYMNLETIPLNPLYFEEVIQENEEVESCPNTEVKEKRHARNVFSYFRSRW
jgi:predicted ribosome quality control (RQC) complex YloA/Tae2 family protein